MQRARPEEAGSHAPGQDRDDGLAAGILRYFGSLVRHLEALASLASLEAKEAASVYLRVAVFVFLTLFFMAFGYVFLVLTVVFLIHYFFAVHWLWITLGMAVLHALLVAVCVFAARRHLEMPVFQHTSAELRKDAESLRGAPKPPPMP